MSGCRGMVRNTNLVGLVVVIFVGWLGGGVWGQTPSPERFENEIINSPGPLGFHYFGSRVVSTQDVMVIGETAYDSATIPRVGTAYVYRRNGSAWTEEDQLLASDGQEEDYFGGVLAIDGSVIVVGVPGDDTDAGMNAGSVYVYRFNGAEWIEEAHLFSPNTSSYEWFGRSAAICGSTFVVGAQSQKAYIYQHDGVSWNHTATLMASDNAGGGYSQTIAMDGDVIAVGAPGTYPTDGTVYVYQFDGKMTWGETAILNASDAQSHDRFGWSLAIQGDAIVVGSIWVVDAGGPASGSAYIFRSNGVIWVEEAILVPSDSETEDAFGVSVAINNGFIVVGSKNNIELLGDNVGSAYVYQFDGVGWSEVQRLIAHDRHGAAHFGSSVTMTNGTIAVGAWQVSTSTGFGAVYVYQTDCNGNGVLDMDDIPSGFSEDLNSNGIPDECEDTLCPGDRKVFSLDADTTDFYGGSVDLDGDVMVVGSPWDTQSGMMGAGSVYVYRFDGANWVEEAHLVPSEGQMWGQFGQSVAISNGILVVGWPWKGTPDGLHKGMVVVYRFDGKSSWVEDSILFASGSLGAVELFGISVDIQDDVIIVGASSEHTPTGLYAGAAYVYRHDGTQWNEEQHLFLPDAEDLDHFGGSVAISGRVIVVGAYEDNTANGFNTGSAFVYRYNGQEWVQEAQLLASNGQTGGGGLGAKFGSSSAISGDTIVVGAYFDEVIDGIHPGSAYIYRYDGSVWFEESHLLASDGQHGDRFGFSVAMDGNTAMIGAVSDVPEAGIQTGSAYVYHFDGSQWIEGEKLLAAAAQAYDDFGRSVALSGQVMVAGAPMSSSPGQARTGSVYVFDPAAQFCRADIAPGFPGCGDRVVDILDLMAVLDSFGPCPYPGGSCAGDIAPESPPGGNGVVNIDDLVAVLNSFGGCP